MKQEGDSSDSKFSKAAPSPSRQWSSFRNPRIVRVSRSFGGKDRHSKVCTIRGLRDRRIRLSVPTAIQLYDLQDRLGLNQPSKVIDWLLDATKNDIDKLPPLQIPQGFGPFQQPMLVSRESNASESAVAPFFDANSVFMKDVGFHSLGIKINTGLAAEDQNTMSKTKSWDVEASLRAKSKEVEKGKWIKSGEQENQDGVCNYSGQVSAQKFFPLSSYSSIPGLLNNPIPFNSYHHWDASNLSLSQFGPHGFLSQTENSLNSQSSLALSSGSQLFFCPPTAMPSLFPPYPPHITSTPVESDLREINHFQLLSSSSQHSLPNSRTTTTPMKPFYLNVNPGLILSQNNNENRPAEDKTDS